MGKLQLTIGGETFACGEFSMTMGGDNKNGETDLILKSYLHWVEDNLIQMIKLIRIFEVIPPEYDGVFSPNVKLRIAPKECPLCLAHYDSILLIGRVTSGCGLCSIMMKTKQIACKDTPYTNVYLCYQALFDKRVKDKIVGMKQLLGYVWEECLFLKRLYHEYKGG